MVIKNVVLHCTEGTSDKIYKLFIEKVAESLYVVNFEYGRRGYALKTGTKTEVPVSAWTADIIFNQVYNQKINKKYKEIDLKYVEENKVEENKVEENKEIKENSSRIATQEQVKEALERLCTME